MKSVQCSTVASVPCYCVINVHRSAVQYCEKCALWCSAAQCKMRETSGIRAVRTETRSNQKAKNWRRKIRMGACSVLMEIEEIEEKFRRKIRVRACYTVQRSAQCLMFIMFTQPEQSHEDTHEK